MVKCEIHMRYGEKIVIKIPQDDYHDLNSAFKNFHSESNPYEPSPYYNRSWNSDGKPHCEFSVNLSDITYMSLTPIKD